MGVFGPLPSLPIPGRDNDTGKEDAMSYPTTARMTGIPPKRTTRTYRVTATPRTGDVPIPLPPNTGRQQAILAFGPRESVFGRPPREDGGIRGLAPQGRTVEAWGATRITDPTGIVNLKTRSRLRRR